MTATDRLLTKIDIFPGLKTYSSLLNTTGMLVCHGLGYHTFSNEAWGLAITATLAFWKLGQDRHRGTR